MFLKYIGNLVNPLCAKSCLYCISPRLSLFLSLCILQSLCLSPHCVNCSHKSALALALWYEFSCHFCFRDPKLFPTSLRLKMMWKNWSSLKVFTLAKQLFSDYICIMTFDQNDIKTILNVVPLHTVLQKTIIILCRKIGHISQM